MSKKKTARIDLKVAPEFKDRCELFAKQVSKSRNAFIEHVVWKALLSPEYFFKCCPTCKIPVFDVEEIAISKGIQEVECVHAHVHYFDFEEEKWIK